MTYGNNCILIKRILESRPWWIELIGVTSNFNFKWQPFSLGIRYDLLNTIGCKQVVNHFEFHSELTSKSGLFLNLQTYSEMNKENVFNYLPLTFLIKIDPSKPNGQILHAIRNFVSFYTVLEDNKQFIINKSTHTTIKSSKTDKSSGHLFPSNFDKIGRASCRERVYALV